MPSPHLAYGGQMKILNAGTADIIVKDKRGNSVRLEPSQTIEVTEDTARKLKPYPFIKIIREVKPEVPKEVEVNEEVKAEPKKKSRKRKNVLSNND